MGTSTAPGGSPRSSLLNLGVFEDKPLLTNVDVRLSTRIESGIKQLLALVTGDGDIVLYYAYGGLAPVVRRIVWFTEAEKAVDGVCFDPSATWLLVSTTDVSLYILPALSIVDEKQKIDCKWSLNDITCFPRHERTSTSRPNCVVWWQTLDSNQNAIIGHEDGHVSMISLTDGQNLGSCCIGEPVGKVDVCQDNNGDVVTLLVTSRERRQWRMMLEQRSSGFLWDGGRLMTSVEFVMAGLANGHVEEKASRSRLQGLKQLSVEKLASLKQKLAETRSKTGRKRVEDDRESTGSSESNSEAVNEKVMYLEATVLEKQFARNRHLLSGYYHPGSLLTVYSVEVDSVPMFVYKLPGEVQEVVLCDRFVYIVDATRRILRVLSLQCAETRLEDEGEFNWDSVVAECVFDGKILAIYKKTDSSMDVEDRRQKPFVLARSEHELNIRRPKIDSCIVVTEKEVREVGTGTSVIEKLVELLATGRIFRDVDLLAQVFGLSAQQLLEYSGDIALSRERFTQAISFYRLSKCRVLKSVLKFAVAGHCQELLSYITVCLGSNNTDMSVSTKKHLSNLAIMSYTEILLRTSSNVFQRIMNFKKFINFLAYNDYYDEILAVNVICQTGLWSILTVIGRVRALAFDIVEILCKVMRSPPQPQTSLTSDITHDCFHSCISDQMFLPCVISKPQYSSLFLQYVKDNLNHFSIPVLKRLTNSLDPSHPIAWSIISKTLQKHRNNQSSSLDSTLDSLDSEPPDELLHSTRDLIETFIQTLIVLNTKTNQDFDVTLLPLVEPPQTTPPPHTHLHPKPRFLSSGSSHVALIRNNTLYTWGTSQNGCLGFGPMVTKYSLPQPVEVLNNFQLELINVSAGRGHTVILTNYGVWTWGSNVYGQLGLSAVVYQAPYPVLVEALSEENVVDVSAGQYHTLALTSDGKVYSWGWGVFGQLGHGHVHDVFKPKKIDFFNDKVVVQISAGHAHSIVLTNDGIVYSFGSNSFGQLGNGTSIKSSVPVQILLNEKITQIATNYFHNLAITTDNKVYMWGASPQVLRHQVHNYKRFKNMQQNDKNYEPAPIDWSSTTPFSIDNKHLFPAMVDTEEIPGHVVQVSTGCNHSAILTKDGSLFLWGQNFEGQIGNGTRGEVASPSLVKINPLASLSPQNGGIIISETDVVPLKCSYVSCGAEFTVAVDYTGKILAWGSNAKAQLGKISEEDDRGLEGKMVMLKTTKRILKIPKSCQNVTDFPKEVPNIPAMHITYKNYDKYPFVNKNLSYLYPLRKIEGVLEKIYVDNTMGMERVLGFIHDREEQTVAVFGQKTLHYVLQTYFGFYDTESVLSKCVEYKNFQAASKISYLDGHFGDSLGFQLSSFRNWMDLEGKWTGEVVRKREVLKVAADSVASRNNVSVISTSCSLESIKQFNDETESQGGFESMCEEEICFLEEEYRTDGANVTAECLELLDNLRLEDSETPQRTDDFSNEIIRKTVTSYVESIDRNHLPEPPEKYDSENNYSSVIDLASKIVEFYCSRPQITENHILMQNVLIKCMQFWLQNNLPVDVLETILLKNMDRYFYPLSILLFCKNFNNNLGEGILKEGEPKKSQKSFEFLKQLSTKFCLQLCSMVLQNVNKS